MAGYLYLGKKKVCPAILIGGGGTTSILPLFDVDNNGLISWKTVIDGSGIKEIQRDSLCGMSGSVFTTGYEVIEEVYFPDLETIGDYGLINAFNEFESIKIVSFPKLKTIGKEGLYVAIGNTSSLISTDFSSLETIDESGMWGALVNSRMTTISFPKLNYIGEDGMVYCFLGSVTLTSVYFNSLTSSSFYDDDVFYNMLNFTQNCTVHFPSNLQSVIGNWSDVLGGFGGTNTTVLFDLPATE